MSKQTPVAINHGHGVRPSELSIFHAAEMPADSAAANNVIPGNRRECLSEVFASDMAFHGEEPPHPTACSHRVETCICLGKHGLE